jgi:sRNA-binding regulator protein Hfq
MSFVIPDSLGFVVFSPSRVLSFNHESLHPLSGSQFPHSRLLCVRGCVLNGEPPWAFNIALLISLGRGLVMRIGPDSTAVGRAIEPESFGNRKLIRPSLNREQARAAEAAPEPRERAARPAERSSGSPSSPRKTAPPEQTHAENFYYQKQIQGKIPMVVVTRDGEQLRGIIEWYDKSCIKLNRPAGQSNLLVYKSAIRYMYKEGEETK